MARISLFERIVETDSPVSLASSFWVIRGFLSTISRIFNNTSFTLPCRFFGGFPSTIFSRYFSIIAMASSRASEPFWNSSVRVHGLCREEKSGTENMKVISFLYNGLTPGCRGAYCRQDVLQLASHNSHRPRGTGLLIIKIKPPRPVLPASDIRTRRFLNGSVFARMEGV